MNRADFRAIRAKIALKRSKRISKVADNAELASISNGDGPRLRPKPLKPVRRLIKRGALKTAIVRLLGLLDRKKNGNQCRLGAECPEKTQHFGTLAYHIVPAQRGDSARFIPENVVWACRQSNYGEVMNRSLYRDKHIAIFGKDRIERIEAIARTFRKYQMVELLELRDKLRSEVAA